MHRLVAYAPDGVRRFTVDRRVLFLGSGDECEVHLPFPGVGARHARLVDDEGRLVIEDLGTSRRGLVVNGERVKRATLDELDEIRIGSIALLLEEVGAPTAIEDPSPAPAPRLAPPGETADSGRLLDHLAAVSRWVLADTGSTTTLEALLLDLLGDLGGGVVFLFQGSEPPGIKFVVATEAEWLGRGDDVLRHVGASSGVLPEPTSTARTGRGELAGTEVTFVWRAVAALERPYLFAVALPNHPGDPATLAACATLADQLILGLVHHVGQYEPILFGRERETELLLAPGLIAGESPAMRRVLDELRAAVRLESPVLLRGEAGVSKELMARSLHGSSPRRDGPFVATSATGVDPGRLEIELFGTEVAGKRGPLRREGKILQADGGTLYLEEVDRLPMRVQDRLMRFLRTGELEATPTEPARPVDVRWIVSAADSLDVAAGRDQFRLDLAYRLSQFVVEVPPLRARRHDLPLLIQAAVNRCCHETGKRVHGITVKAMEALTAHDWPGNLPELEAVVRRLVYLCPSGRPIDDSLLPREVRLSKLDGLRPALGDDLRLDRLVADTERAAIREALRRSDHNKSEAARQLGLSRNGLAAKLRRLGLET